MENNNKTKARIITNLENTNLTNLKKLYIVSKEIIPNIFDNYIAYNSDDSMFETRIGLGKNNQHRALYCSELIQKLRNKSWLTSKQVYIDDFGDDLEVRLVSSETKNSLSPIYDVNPLQLREVNINGEIESTLVNTSPQLTSYTFSKIWNNIFEVIENEDLRKKVKDLIEDMATSGEIYLYNTSKSAYDILSGDSSIILIDQNSIVYTNSLDIKTILSKKIFYKQSSSKVDLSVQYTKYDDSIDAPIVYNYDTVFDGFSIDTNGDLVFQNFSQDINKEITIEYIDGIIKVIPISGNIKECIINNCIVTYGKSLE